MTTNSNNKGREVNCRLLAYRLANMPEFKRRHITVTCSGATAYCHADAAGQVTVNVPDAYSGSEHTLLMYIYHEIGHVLTTNLSRKGELVGEHHGDPFAAEVFNIIEDQSMELRVRRMFPASDEHITAGNRDLFNRDKVAEQAENARVRLDQSVGQNVSQTNMFVQEVTNYCLVRGYAKSDSYHRETAEEVNDSLLRTMCQDWPKLKAVLDPLLDRECQTWQESEVTAEQIVSEIQNFLGSQARKQQAKARAAKRKAAKQGQSGQGGQSDQNHTDNQSGQDGQGQSDSQDSQDGQGDTQSGSGGDTPEATLRRYSAAAAPVIKDKDEQLLDRIRMGVSDSGQTTVPALRWTSIQCSHGFGHWSTIKSDWAIPVIRNLSASMRRKFVNAVTEMTRQNRRNSAYGSRLNGRVITRLGLDDPNVFRSTCQRMGIDLEVMFLVDNSGSMHTSFVKDLDGPREIDYLDRIVQGADLITAIALAGADALKRIGVPCAVYSYDAREDLVEVMPVSLPGWSPAWHRRANLPLFGSGTPTPNALKGIMERFTGKKKRKIIISITDGESSSMAQEQLAVRQAASMGISCLSILLDVSERIEENNIKIYGARNIINLDMDKPEAVAGAIAGILRNQIRQSV